MHRRPPSLLVSIAGLTVAVGTALLAMAVCLSAEFITQIAMESRSLESLIKAMMVAPMLFTTMIFMFGWPKAAIYVSVSGGIIVAVRRYVARGSLLFYAAAGLVSGILVASIEAGGHLTWVKALPIAVSGCLSASAYWAVVEPRVDP